MKQKFKLLSKVSVKILLFKISLHTELIWKAMIIFNFITRTGFTRQGRGL